MHSTRFLAAAVVLALLLAGCLDGGLGGKDPVGRDGKAPIVPPLRFDPDWDSLALPFEQGHDHFNTAQHENLSTPNFSLLGWDPLVSTHAGMTVGGHLCGDAHDNGQKRYGVVHGLSTNVAFILVDVTDATKPAVIGELYMPNSRTRDLAITPDLKYVVLGTSTPPTPSAPSPLEGAYWRSACNDEDVPVTMRDTQSDLPTANGAVLVNIQNPKAPVIESYVPLPALGAHSMYATQIGSQYFVLASVVNVVAAITYFVLMEITSTPAGPKLNVLSVLNESPLESNAPVQNGHNDGVIAIHPITKKTYAYLAHWHQGLVIVDITNPRAPMNIGRWSDNPPGNQALATNDYGDIHEALPLEETWNGKHYTFVGQEILGHPSNRPSGYMKALDTTDPTKPKEAAHWNLPSDVTWGGPLQFSTHYISRVNRTIFMSHYHAGLWAIDLTNLETDPKLPAIGVFVPANKSPKPPPNRVYGWTPTVMENNALPNGDLVVWDSSSGVYMVHFDATRPAPAKVWDPMTK